MLIFKKAYIGDLPYCPFNCVKGLGEGTELLTLTIVFFLNSEKICLRKIPFKGTRHCKRVENPKCSEV